MTVKKYDDDFYYVGTNSFWQFGIDVRPGGDIRWAEFGFFGDYEITGQGNLIFNEQNLGKTRQFMDEVEYCLCLYHQWADHGVLPKEGDK